MPPDDPRRPASAPPRREQLHNIGRRRAWAIWLVALSVYVLAVFHRSSLGVAGLLAAQRFGISATELAFFTVLQLLVYAGMQIPVGVLLDRFGARLMLLAGLVTMTVGQFTFAFASSFPLAVVARAVLGAGDAMIFVSVLRLVTAWFLVRQAPLVTQLTGQAGQLGAILAAGPLAWALHALGWIELHHHRNLPVARALNAESLALRRKIGYTRDIAWSLSALGSIASAQCAYAEARALHEEQLAIERSLNHRQGIAGALWFLGKVAYLQGDYGDARALYAESLALARESVSTFHVSMVLMALAEIARDQDEHTQATLLLDEALELGDKLDNSFILARVRYLQGQVAYDRGALTQAEACYAESLATFQELGVRVDAAWARARLALVVHQQGNPAQAASMLQESLTEFHQLTVPHAVAWCLEILAPLLVAQGKHPARALRLFGAAETLRATLAIGRPPVEQAPYAIAVAAARAELDGTTGALAWATGRAMPTAWAVAAALADPDNGLDCAADAPEAPLCLALYG